MVNCAKWHLVNQLKQFVRCRPLFSLAVAVILAVLGCGILSLAFIFGFYSSGGIFGGLITLGAIAVFAAWCYEYKRLLFPSRCDKSVHRYEKGHVHSLGQLVSTLRYEQNIPILQLHTTDPWEKGRLIGKHVARPFLVLWDRYIQFLPYAMRMVHRKVYPHPLAFIKGEIHRLQLTFPDFLIREIDGFLEEVNKCLVRENHRLWCKRKAISLEDFKALYAFGDIYKGLGGCGAAVRSTKDKIELMRNLDWYSMGVLADSTLVKLSSVRRHTEGGPRKVLSLGFPPGLMGLSMANDCGLVITLNEATKMSSKRNHVGGYPQFLLLREIAEHCSTVQEAISFITQHPPAASHLLTLMDRHGDGAVVQMLPTVSQEIFTIRPLEGGVVHTTNHFFDQNNQVIPGSEAMASSYRRYQTMQRALQEGRSARKVLDAANCRFTVQSMIFTYHDGEFILDFNFDNYFAGNINADFVRINLYKLFS